MASLPVSVASLKSPCFLVDLKKAKANAERMLNRARSAEVKLRPHVKTHKTVQGALLQVGSSAQEAAIVVSTLREANFFADAGFHDILYGMPISPDKFLEAACLSKRISNFHLLIDNGATVSLLNDFAAKENVKFSVYLKIDTGYHRAGVNWDAEPSVDLAHLIHQSSSLTLTGIYSHSGHSYEKQQAHAETVGEEERSRMVHFMQRLTSSGITVPIVSCGATPTCSLVDSWTGVNEIHPGNYIFYDRQQLHIGSCTIEDIACMILARIVSHYPDRNRMLVDAGALALSKDLTPQGGFAEVVGHPKLRVVKISQEHGIIETVDGSPIDFNSYPLGSAVRLLPNHSCLAAACFDKYYVVDGETVIDEWIPCKFW
eukprot:GILK01008869.1.p1 GENE.GILK01008869.1~~GILK01008869.1.p1  ORF type:complete len:373 (-),score=60.60 GILK01008869.1:100-1218(-)